MIGEWIFWFETGKNNVIGRLQSTASLVLMIGTFLKVWEENLGIEVSLEFLIILSLFFLISNLILGWLYCKTGIMKKEQEAKYKENPQIQETYEAIKRLEKRVTEWIKN